jgi:hypothetical protein
LEQLDAIFDAKVPAWRFQKAEVPTTAEELEEQSGEGVLDINEKGLEIEHDETAFKPSKV